MIILDDLRREYPNSVNEQLADLARRLRLPKMRQAIWERLLSAEDRARGEADPSKIQDIVLIWAGLRRLRPVQAVVDLASEMDMLTPRERKWLLRDLGERASTTK